MPPREDSPLVIICLLSSTVVLLIRKEHYAMRLTVATELDVGCN